MSTTGVSGGTVGPGYAGGFLTSSQVLPGGIALIAAAALGIIYYSKEEKITVIDVKFRTPRPRDLARKTHEQTKAIFDKAVIRVRTEEEELPLPAEEPASNTPKKREPSIAARPEAAEEEPEETPAEMVPPPGPQPVKMKFAPPQARTRSPVKSDTGWHDRPPDLWHYVPSHRW